MNKILWALLAGVAVGVLLAPDKGSETIKKLREKLNDYKDQASDQANELARKANSVVNKGREKLNEAFD